MSAQNRWRLFNPGLNPLVRVRHCGPPGPQLEQVGIQIGGLLQGVVHSLLGLALLWPGDSQANHDPAAWPINQPARVIGQPGSGAASGAAPASAAASTAMAADASAASHGGAGAAHAPEAVWREGMERLVEWRIKSPEWPQTWTQWLGLAPHAPEGFPDLHWQRLTWRMRGVAAAKLGLEEEANVARKALLQLADHVPAEHLQADLFLVEASLQDHLGLAIKDVAALHRFGDWQEQLCLQAQPTCDLIATWTFLHLRALQAERQSQWVEAREAEQRAAEMARRGELHLPLALSLSSQAVHAQRLGAIAAARQWLAEADRVARRASNAEALVLVRLNEARFLLLQGDAAGDERALEEAWKLAKGLKRAHIMALVQVNLCDLHRRKGRMAAGLAAASEARPVLLARRDMRLLAVLQHNAGLLHLAQGQLTQGRQELEQARLLFDRAGATGTTLAALDESVEALAKAGDTTLALHLFHQAQALRERIEQDNREAITSELRQRYQAEAAHEELQLLARDNELKAARLRTETQRQRIWGMALLLLMLAAGVVGMLIRRSREVTRALHDNEALLRLQAERDPLTGLANRRRFRELLTLRGDVGLRGALLLVDVDHFKPINDTLGHAIGDQALVEVGRRLVAAVRGEDMVCRWGGEEFLIHASDLSGADLDALAERLLRRVGDEPLRLSDGRPLHITVSVGYAQFPLPPNRVNLRWEAALNLVDMALYTAKALGRDRAVGIESAFATDAASLVVWAADFEQACQRGDIRLRVRGRGTPA